MGCLFGYCGPRLEGLLEKMALIMSHRCAQGWERTEAYTSQDRVAEIGRGIAPWSAANGSNVAGSFGSDAAVAYSGFLFNGSAKPSSKAEVLLSASRGNTETFIKGLDGAFVMALFRNGDLYLTRDCSGIKALYWTLHRGRLLFASEIKALFAEPTLPRKLRVGALTEYLTFSFVPGSGTMFDGISELQPGSTLKFAGTHCGVSRHFTFEDLEFSGDNLLPEHHYSAIIREELEKSVIKCSKVSDRPPAVFVSGGIDSSAVLAATARHFSGTPVKTLSVHFGADYPNENQYVSLMVERYKTDHTWLEIRPEGFLDRMRQIIWSLDDPIGDPITVPNYLLAEAASKVSSVVFNGEGGDPCFGGPKNIPMILAQVYGPSSHCGGEHWMERDYLLSYRRCFSDLAELLDPDVWRESGGEEALYSILGPFLHGPVPKSFLNKLMATNIRLKGANLILVKVDKMTSANGVLALPPLFTKGMVEASMACPPWFKLNGNTEKAVLKKAVEDIVPRLIIERAKSGMMVPVRFWFRGEMRKYAKKVLSKKNLKQVGLFNVDYVHSLLDYSVTDIHGLRYGTKLWMLTTFMLWFEQMIRQR